MKKYVVIDQEFKNNDLISDERYVFDSKSEAEDNALYRWNHLTESEKENRAIMVAAISEGDLDDEAFDDEGTDFRMFSIFDPIVTYSK